MLLAIIGGAATLVGAVTGLVGALLGAAMQRRRESGSAATADASTLFNASFQLIRALMDAQQQLGSRLDGLTARFDEMLRRVEQLVDQQGELIEITRNRPPSGPVQ